MKKRQLATRLALSCALVMGVMFPSLALADNQPGGSSTEQEIPVLAEEAESSQLPAEETGNVQGVADADAAPSDGEESNSSEGVPGTVVSNESDVQAEEPAEGTTRVESQLASKDENVTVLKTPAESSLDVVYVSAKGDDETGEGTKNSPVATLAKAVDVVKDGGTVQLLTNVEASSRALISGKTITINGNGCTVSRSEDFERAIDQGRGGYHSAMIEVANESKVTFADITLDDKFLREADDFNLPGPSTEDNTGKAHDGIIASYGDGHSTIILGDGATLKNFGGLSAVYITGEGGAGATLVMQSGSKICDDNLGKRAGGYAAVFNHGGTFTAEQGSSIEGIDGRAVYADNGGITTFAGTITNITSSDAVKQAGDAGVAYYGDGNTVFTLASGGVIENINSHDGTAADSVLHLISCTFKTEEGSEIRNISPSGIADMNGATVDLGGSISNVNAKDVLFRLRGTQGTFYLRETGSIKECTADTAIVYLNGGKPTVEVAGTIEDVSPTVFFMSNNGSRKDGSITLTETGVITNVTGYGMRLEDPSNVTIAGTITNCSSYALQYYPKSNQSLLTIKSTATIENNNNGGAQVRAQNNTLPATDAQEHIVLEPGGLDGNTTVDLIAFDVMLDSDYENIKVGNAGSSTATAVKNAVASQHADWTVVGSSAVWIQPSTSEVHFAVPRSYSMKKTALFAALLPLNEDGTPVSGAEAILQEVGNSDSVDVTLTGLAAGQSYAMMFVNNNEYTLSADDTTIYTGGGQGDEAYDDGGFPTVTMYNSVDEITSMTVDGEEIVEDEANGVTFESALTDLIDVAYLDGQGNPVESDVNPGEYTIVLNWKDGAAPDVRINGNEVNSEFEPGTLIVRYVENVDAAQNGDNTYELVSGEPAEAVDHAVAIAKESDFPISGQTKFYTNDQDERVVDAEGIRLLDDDLLADFGDGRQELMEQKAVDFLGSPNEGQAYRYDFHYLDLVDAYNGNAWVSASNGTTVYLPYPEGVTAENAENLGVKVIHYKDLHREYGIAGHAEVEEALAACEMEAMEVEFDANGIKFDVGREGFSPFAVVWQTQAHTITASAEKGGTIAPEGDVTVAEGADETFAMTPDEGYEIKQILVDGQAIDLTDVMAEDGTALYTFEDVEADHSIAVSFEKSQVVGPDPADPGDDAGDDGNANITERPEGNGADADDSGKNAAGLPGTGDSPVLAALIAVIVAGFAALVALVCTALRRRSNEQ